MRGEKCIVVSPNNPATEIAISRYNVYLTSFHDKTCNRSIEVSVSPPGRHLFEEV